MTVILDIAALQKQRGQVARKFYYTKVVLKATFMDIKDDTMGMVHVNPTPTWV